MPPQSFFSLVPLLIGFFDACSQLTCFSSWRFHPSGSFGQCLISFSGQFGLIFSFVPSLQAFVPFSFIQTGFVSPQRQLNVCFFPLMRELMASLFAMCSILSPLVPRPSPLFLDPLRVSKFFT